MLPENDPLVSCIMPTYNRRQFIPYAIDYFIKQEYSKKELIIIDDGTESVEDLVPQTDNIRYYRLQKKISLGAKLNLGCTYARGNVIAHWDDDDWYASRRLHYQVDTLHNSKSDICGMNNLIYYDLRDKYGYRYVYPADQRTWLLGSSLCYTKKLWESHHFADINVGMDGLFVWGIAQDRITVLPDSTIAVHLIHDNNVSPKKTNGSWWHTYPVEEIKKIMQQDWANYTNGTFTHHKIQIKDYDTRKPDLGRPTKKLKNIYACLVHENEDAIIDLVRNLHYHDPASTILLYNGGENKDLFKNRFSYGHFGAVIHPKPVPVKHGYLHTYALNCMQFSLENFSFDSFTIVDSDQLALRSGYSDYMGRFFSSKSNIGMLSSRPERITPQHKDDAVWPAVQAFKEYDLWKPLLEKFPQGEKNFVHWTFWPSTVFTSDAVKDLMKLFNGNKLLQQIMKQSKIWATEEVIFPTLVKLLGYEICLNPCSYEFVRFRKSYNLQELYNALNSTSAYWIHPIERKYENYLRKYARQRFGHYLLKSNKESFTNNSNTTMLTTFSLINKIKNIDGWLNDKEADLLMATTLKACKEMPAPQYILEIGSYQGKSTVLLGSVIKEYYPQAKVYAVDPHEGTVGAVDQGVHMLTPTLDKFNKNVSEAGLSDVIELIKSYSFNVEWDKPVSLLFIDGLHDYPNVAKDFWHFSDWVCPGAYVAFHDYADYYPGVKAFVDELLQAGNYRKISRAESLIVVQKL